MKNHVTKRSLTSLFGLRYLVIALTLGISASSFAQQGGGSRPSAAERFESVLTILVDSVGIDKDQAAKVKVVNSKYEKIMTEARQQMGDGADREQMREKSRASMQAYDKEILDILTDDQKVTYSKIKDSRRNQMQQQQKNGQGRPNDGNKSQRGQRGAQ